MGTNETESDKGLTLNAMRDQAYATAVEKGWWEEGQQETRIPVLLCLIHSEVSEALEAWRELPPGNLDHIVYGAHPKPEGFAIELADIIIRIGDLCGAYNIDLESAVKTKMAFNRTRSHRHGGKRA